MPTRGLFAASLWGSQQALFLSAAIWEQVAHRAVQLCLYMLVLLGTGQQVQGWWLCRQA